MSDVHRDWVRAHRLVMASVDYGRDADGTIAACQAVAEEIGEDFDAWYAVAVILA